MKKLLYLILVVGFLIPNLVFAQGNKSLSDLKNYVDTQIANATASISLVPAISATAMENLSNGDFVKVINDMGTNKAFKFNSLPITTSSVFKSSGLSDSPKALSLTDTLFVIAYRETSTGQLKIKAGNILNNGSIQWGTESSALGNISGIFLNKLTDNSFVISLSNSVSVIVVNPDLTIDNSGGTYGSGFSSIFGMEMLTSTKIAIAGIDGSGYTRTAIGDISGKVITFGSGYTVSSYPSLSHGSIKKYNSSSYVITSMTQGVSPSSLYLYYVPYSGNTIQTPNVVQVSTSANGSGGQLSDLIPNTSKFILTYIQDSVLKAKLADISNLGGIASSTTYICPSTLNISLSQTLTPLYGNNFTQLYAIHYYLSGQTSSLIEQYVKYQAATDRIEWGIATIPYSYLGIYHSVINIGKDRLLYAVRRSSDEYGYTFIKYNKFNAMTAFNSNNINSGEVGIFSLLDSPVKITNNTFNLSAGTSYYLDASSILTPIELNNSYVGYALDTTSIYINGSNSNWGQLFNLYH